jgi:hypothetical protein
MLYLCGTQTIKQLIMSTSVQQTEEKKLRVKLSTFQTDLTFNQWVEKYGVSSGYQEPTKYFQGNPSSGFVPLEVSISPFERLVNFFSQIDK